MVAGADSEIEWQFDHTDPALGSRMNEVLGSLREKCPVIHSDRHGGFWAVLTHDGAKRIAGDPETFSSAHGLSVPPFNLGEKHLPVETDPPEHTEYRRIIQPRFTRRAVAQYEPILRDVTAQRISEMAGQGRADLVAELARYVPVTAITLILGLPPGDGAKFLEWTSGMFAATASGDVAAQLAYTRNFEDYIAAQVAGPSGDAETVIAAIASAQIQDRPLTLTEQIGMVILLTIAGFETTVHAIGTMLYYLASVDGLRDAVLADPELIPKMINECLRFEPPVVGLCRTALYDAEVGGQSLAVGEKVMFLINAANRDPSMFERPDDFVYSRDNNPHLTFGYGVHRCAGEHLAMLELRVVAEEMLRIAPRYQIAEGFQPQWLIGVTRGLTALPVVFPQP